MASMVVNRSCRELPHLAYLVTVMSLTGIICNGGNIYITSLKAIMVPPPSDYLTGTKINN